MKDILILYNCPPAEKNRAEPEEQKGKKEGGWGEGIFALLRLRLERFRFSLIKRKPKQKFFHLQLKEKNGGQKKIKNVMKKFLFWFVVAKRRQAETHQQNYQFSRSVRFRSEPPRARRVVSRGSVQKRLEFQPKGTAKIENRNRKQKCGRVSDWGFSEIRRLQNQKIQIDKIHNFCYHCFVSKESNDSYFYTIKSSILWQLYHRTLSEYEQNKD